MKQLDTLPETIRKAFEKSLQIGDIFTHKRSGRDWTVSQIHRKDHTVELRGPGVEKKMQISFDDLKRSWIKK